MILDPTLDPYPGGHTETGEDTHTRISRRGLVRQHPICSGSARGWETALECVHCNIYTAPHLALHVQLVAPTHGRAVLAFCCARMLNERVGQLQALSQLQTLETQTRSRPATPSDWASAQHPALPREVAVICITCVRASWPPVCGGRRGKSHMIAIM